MSKAGSEVILKSLLNRHIDIDALPWGPEEQVPAGIETVIPAEEIRPRTRRGVVEIDGVMDFRDRNDQVGGGHGTGNPTNDGGRGRGRDGEQQGNDADIDDIRIKQEPIEID